MSLLRITRIDLRGTERELKRIADVLEAFLAHAGIRLTSQPAEESKSPDVSYVDEEKAAIAEALEAVGKARRPLDEEEPENG